MKLKARVLLPVCVICVLSDCGCAGMASHVKTRDPLIKLTLVAPENVRHIWPPAVFVERSDDTGDPLDPRLAALGQKYVPGVAILVVENVSSERQALRDWPDRNWRIVIRSETKPNREIPLVDLGFDTFFREPWNILEPGQVMAVVVGGGERMPLNKRYMANLNGTCSIHVKYFDTMKTLTSNELPVNGPP